MINYSQFVARRASPVPLLGAIASLAAIAIWLGDPQAGVGTAPCRRCPGGERPRQLGALALERRDLASRPQLERASTRWQPAARRWAAPAGGGGPLQPRSSCGRALTAHGVRDARRDRVHASATDAEGWAHPCPTGSHGDGRHRTAAPEWRRDHLERAENLVVG